ncbi:nitroreductase family deazaflavin-dependent oxidoreductase [Streptomyces castrisilvae]|uniref:Nitroreductase family deazaflavin-dependent oxidoreductase n=1 Tax=Streptomyces castrisilvae TaxID=3033811 RepID=A0ABY9HMC3_9ACTN|nr:nitroreductase family deazaflavin-dependent oxidoreductase [Streptomyces sp. Mut1]WLQ35559.1 nitroreductase family deazaflavin-dependent oxidoreductase [Streptomyces sp. Mut1]
MAAAGVRLVQKVSSTRVFARIAPHVVPAMDRTVHRLTRGRVLPSARMLPGLVLTVPGARSGQPRTTPLVCMPQPGDAGAVDGGVGDGGVGDGGVGDGGVGHGKPGGGWVLVGSNFGRPGHPAWTANLMAHPEEAVVNWNGRDIPVRARLLAGEERAVVWKAALAFWPPYAAYQARIDREIRLFRLDRREVSP